MKSLEDGEIAAAERARSPRRRRRTRAGGDRLPWDDEIAEKRGYDSFMLKEIHEQPHAVGETIARNLGRRARSGAASAGGLALARVRRVVIVACGTAYHAGLWAAI